ncbi:MAG TPA: hypothetical protein VJP08_05550 [Actinomycetota bacterium]|nr:hypothetical protein [Actinomycetota bacterium]
MGTSVGTIEARPVARSVLLRTLMVLAAIVIGWAAVATAWSLAADRPTGQSAVTRPDGATSLDERKPRGFGPTFAETGHRNPAHLPKR